ncbi:hypothetical protein LHP98_16225 [Rhodobacter sp. Har01]|nr:hypothetical protein [Rhodobacter sp. Har01]MCB6179670.1 hypothetical protein [Rhodobacter sp. Har01]
MLKAMKTFARDEDGAITVDWVVLTALILGIQIIVLIASMRVSMVDVSESVGDKVTEYGEFLE